VFSGEIEEALMNDGRVAAGRPNLMKADPAATLSTEPPDFSSASAVRSIN
jgi:hypothetical protein